MTGFIYVIASGAGPYKIGYSNNPRKRLTMLRTSSSDSLTLLGVVPGTMAHEQELHRLLKPWRVRREWFTPCRAMQPLLDGLRPMPCAERKPRPRDDLSGWLLNLSALVEADGRTPRQLSLAAGLGPNFLSQAFTTGKSPSVGSLSKLAAAMGRDVGELLSGVAA